MKNKKKSIQSGKKYISRESKNKNKKTNGCIICKLRRSPCEGQWNDEKNSKKKEDTKMEQDKCCIKGKPKKINWWIVNKSNKEILENEY